MKHASIYVIATVGIGIGMGCARPSSYPVEVVEAGSPALSGDGVWITGEALGLTPQQTTEIARITAELASANGSLMERARELLPCSDSPAATREVAELLARMSENRRAAVDAIQSVLTPEQRDRARRLMERGDAVGSVSMWGAAFEDEGAAPVRWVVARSEEGPTCEGAPSRDPA